MILTLVVEINKHITHTFAGDDIDIMDTGLWLFYGSGRRQRHLLNSQLFFQSLINKKQAETRLEESAVEVEHFPGGVGVGVVGKGSPHLTVVLFYGWSFTTHPHLCYFSFLFWKIGVLIGF